MIKKVYIVEDRLGVVQIVGFDVGLEVLDGSLQRVVGQYVFYKWLEYVRFKYLIPLTADMQIPYEGLKLLQRLFMLLFSLLFLQIMNTWLNQCFSLGYSLHSPPSGHFLMKLSKPIVKSLNSLHQFL